MTDMRATERLLEEQRDGVLAAVRPSLIAVAKGGFRSPDRVIEINRDLIVIPINWTIREGETLPIEFRVTLR